VYDSQPDQVRQIPVCPVRLPLASAFAVIVCLGILFTPQGRGGERIERTGEGRGTQPSLHPYTTGA
jgi:hypothetical protein